MHTCPSRPLQALHPNPAGEAYTPHDFDGMDLDLEEQYSRLAGSVTWGTL